MTPKEFQELLDSEVLIIDGAMGTMTQNLAYGPEIYGGEDFQMLSDILVLSRPEAIRNIHFQYFQAGASAAETNTLCSSPMRLEEHDFDNIDDSEFPPFEDGRSIKDLTIEEISYRLNKQAAELAVLAKQDYEKDESYDGRKLLVLGSIGPSNWVLSSTQADLKKGTFDAVKDNFYQAVLGLIDGGADALLFETQQDILELKCAILGAKQALKQRNKELPIIAQVTVDSHAKMQIFNTDIIAAYTTLRHIGIHAFGVNCGLGPDQLIPTVKKLSRFSDIPISIIPNAGLPESVGGQTVFKMTPQLMAEQMFQFVDEFGMNIIGGCCGTTPDHIREMRRLVGNRKPTPRKIEQGHFISGPQNAVKLDSSEALIRIGERLNVRGSKKVRDAVEHSSPLDQEALEEVVSEQTRDLGLEVIDVCMDSNIVDTTDTLVEVIRAQTMDFPGAMCLDSFDVSALEAAIKAYPGRPIINSVSLEEYAPGVDKIDAVMSITKEHAPVYVALTTDISGPAVTADKKIELARKIVEKSQKKHGVGPDQLFIDINAFPIGSESSDDINFSMESLNAIPEIKKIDPNLKTIIGVGNLTNGLAKKPYMRKVLTSIFLDEGRKRGLDSAIVNPNHYVPVDSLPKDDYELGKKVILQRDLDAFAELEEIALKKKGDKTVKKENFDDLDPITAICTKIKQGHKEREQGFIEFKGQRYSYDDRIVIQTAGIIEDMEPLNLINNHLMPAMEELGTEFAAGTVSLPHLLKSADVMKQVMGFLESYLKISTGSDASEATGSKGTIVLGTVYQDVHSIGKDLTKTLMENYGYKVIDLGVQVPVADFVETAKKHDAMAVGMSALLVQTSNHMITVSSLLEEEKLKHLPILVGGAPVNQRHASFVALAGREDETTMRDNVFYCRSGMDGVNVLNQLNEKDNLDELFQKNLKKLKSAYQSGLRLDKERDELFATLPKRKVDFAAEYSYSEGLGNIEKVEIPVKEFVPYINQKLLFTLNWKYGGSRSWEKKGTSEQELIQTMHQWVDKASTNGWLLPQAVFMILPCVGSENSVTIFNPKTDQEMAKLTFNDMIGKGKKDIFNVARYFNPGKKDIVALQLSTGGPDVRDVIEEMKINDREGALLLQGLSDRLAEDMAEYINKHIDRLVYGDKDMSSKRYSPGYPSMTDITNNKVIADLLEGCSRLGIELTEGFEFNPTGTTAAVVCFHPDADYQ
ncbi:MAG: homocysteine S-methyltransferase family protein [Proteobacteria bacterium]|nr:homocysteine S-methyltransferase family protein [Pseudomonadota bacterium]